MTGHSMWPVIICFSIVYSAHVSRIVCVGYYLYNILRKLGLISPFCGVRCVLLA